MIRIGLIFFMLVLLTACTTRYTSSGEKHYLDNRNGVQLIIPPPLISANISHFYDLPDQNKNAKIGISPPVERLSGAF